MAGSKSTGTRHVLRGKKYGTQIPNEFCRAVTSHITSIIKLMLGQEDPIAFYQFYLRWFL